MKIVDRKTFLAMPTNTLFLKYRPAVFGPLGIKCGSIEASGDFWSQQITGEVGGSDIFSILDDAAENGSSFRFDLDCASRDGEFDDDQLFAVYEPSDVAKLIACLRRCLPEGEPK